MPLNRHLGGGESGRPVGVSRVNKRNSRALWVPEPCSPFSESWSAQRTHRTHTHSTCTQYTVTHPCCTCTHTHTTCTHVHTYTYAHTVHTCTLTHTCTQSHTHTVHTCTQYPCTYTCAFMYTHIHMPYIHALIHDHIYMHIVHICAYMHALAHIFTHVHIYRHTHVIHAHLHTYTCTHIYTHAHSHVHTHSCSQPPPRPLLPHCLGPAPPFSPFTSPLRPRAQILESPRVSSLAV